MTTKQQTPRFGAQLAKQNGNGDADAYALLRRPFTATAVKFKPQTLTKDKTKALASFYVDARLVAERLNSVVGEENWTEMRRPIFESDGRTHASFHFPVECRLTVLGATHTDVGTYASGAPDDKALKSAYSDSLKRAAVNFGVGAYLYALPKWWAPMADHGRGFSKEGEQQLRRQYEQWLSSQENRWGEPLDHGDLEDFEHGDAAVEPVGDASAGQGATTASAAPAQPPSEDTSQLANVSAVFRALPLEKRQALAKAYHDSTEDSPTTRRVSQWLIEQYPQRLDDLASLADDLDLPF